MTCELYYSDLQIHQPSNLPNVQSKSNTSRKIVINYKLFCLPLILVVAQKSSGYVRKLAKCSADHRSPYSSCKMSVTK